MAEHILSLSYGKDSLACFEACKLLGLPIDRAVHAEVWATDTIPADLPPMVEFKKKADRIIKERYGITVEHITAMRPNGGGQTLSSDNFTLYERIKFADEPYMVSLLSKVRGAIANLKSPPCRKQTYEEFFYRKRTPRGNGKYTTYGFPMMYRGNWCNSRLKMAALENARNFPKARTLRAI